MNKAIKIIGFLSIIFSTSCVSDDYKYRIIGMVKTEKGFKDAVWYSDTICFDYDTLYYINSDSSVVRIKPPYEIQILNKNKNYEKIF